MTTYNITYHLPDHLIHILLPIFHTAGFQK